MESGRVDRARLGVQFGPASESLIRALDLPRGAAVISSVQPGSAADRAGLEAGDVVVEVNGQKLTNHLQLSQWIGAMRPGADATIVVVRDEERRTFDVQLGGWDVEEEIASSDRGTEERSDRAEMMDDLGIRLSDITPEVARRAGLEGNVEGVMITQVDPSSQAAREAALSAGSVIIEIDRQPVRNLDEFENVYRAVAPGKAFLVKLITGDDQTYVTALTKPE